MCKLAPVIMILILSSVSISLTAKGEAHDIKDKQAIEKAVLEAHGRIVQMASTPSRLRALVVQLRARTPKP